MSAATSFLEKDPPIYLTQDMAFELLSSVVRKKLLALKAPKWMTGNRAVRSLDDLYYHLSDEMMMDHDHLDWLREFVVPIMHKDVRVFSAMKGTIAYYEDMHPPPQYYKKIMGPRTEKRLKTAEHEKREGYYKEVVKKTAHLFKKLMQEQKVKVLEVEGVPREDLVIIQFAKEIDFVGNIFDLQDPQSMTIARQLKEFAGPKQDEEEDNPIKNPVDVLKKYFDSSKDTRKLALTTSEQTKKFSNDKLVTVKLGLESNKFQFGSNNGKSFAGSRKERLTAGLKKVISDTLCCYFNQSVSDDAPFDMEWSLFFLSTKTEGDQIPHTDCDPSVLYGNGGRRSEMHYLVDCPLTNDGMSLNVWPKKDGVLCEDPIIVNVEAGQMIVRSPKLVHGGAFMGPKMGTEALRVHMECAMNKKQASQLSSSMIYSSDENGKRYASQCNRRDGKSFLVENC